MKKNYLAKVDQSARNIGVDSFSLRPFWNTMVPKNLGVNTFPDPIGHFGALWGAALYTWPSTSNSGWGGPVQGSDGRDKRVICDIFYGGIKRRIQGLNMIKISVKQQQNEVECSPI